MTSVIQHRESPVSDTSSQAKECYREAYRIVREALSCDEKRDLPTAQQLYLRAKQLLKKAASLSTDRDLVAKIGALLDKVNTRLRDFESKPPGAPISANYSQSPPSYEDISKDKVLAASAPVAAPNSANIILSLDRVSIYHVLESGEIKSQSPSTLYLCEFNQRSKGQPPAFLGCGTWVTPVVPGKTIVYRPTAYLYMWPDPRTYYPDCDVSQTFTGLVLDSTVSEKDRKQFHFAIESLCAVREGILHGPEPPSNSDSQMECDTQPDSHQGWGDWLSEKVTSGSSYISGMIGKGGDKGDQLIESGGEKIRSSIEPASEAASIYPAVESGLFVGKKVTGAAVTVGDFVLSNLAKLTWAAGEQVHSYVSNTDTAKNCTDNHNAQQALSLSKSSARSGGVLYLSASDAAKKLLGRTSKEIVSSVEHRYGGAAGNATDKSIGIGVDAVDLVSYFNWKSLAVKFGAKALSEGASRHGEEQHNAGHK